MAYKERRDVTYWLSKDTFVTTAQKSHELLATRSAKIAAAMKNNSHQDISSFLRDIPAEPETFELVARFCHGFELDISAENVVSLTCIAHYLEMTEQHSPNNLLKKALTFFEQRVLPSWNETVQAFRTTENILQQAVNLGLVDKCLESIITKALADPSLLGEPIKILAYGEDSEDIDDRYRLNPRRRLFIKDWNSENLTSLSLQLYEPTIQEMNRYGVRSEYVAASICQYVKKWVGSMGEEDMSILTKNSQREVIEAMERLLPQRRGLITCENLFEMLRFAIVLQACSDCRNGFEIRIGKQLDQATVKDLLIPSQGYAKEVQYDIECIRRILKNFYANSSSLQMSDLIAVAELIEEFLAEIASEKDLNTNTFISLAEMSNSVSLETQRSSDGIYRAISIYLDKHRCLTESERMKICQVLNCQKMTPEACEHAVKNENLPLRLVVQVLFMGQLHLRETITNEVQNSDKVESEGRGGEEELKTEMVKMNNKVMELEKECYEMKKEIEGGCSHGRKKEKGNNMWREVKRKFGCMSSIPDCNCQVKRKKIHPKLE